MRKVRRPLGVCRGLNEMLELNDKFERFNIELLLLSLFTGLLLLLEGLFGEEKREAALVHFLGESERGEVVLHPKQHLWGVLRDLNPYKLGREVP